MRFWSPTGVRNDLRNSPQKQALPLMILAAPRQSTSHIMLVVKWSFPHRATRDGFQRP